MITKKYLVYFSHLGFGVRWPVAWEFPTAAEWLMYAGIGVLIAGYALFLTGLVRSYHAP